MRVYALETGGVGTYDMQAGIHPIKKTGRAISSALGYAQLLDANSVNELARSGATFIAHLNRKFRDPNNSPARTASLKHKLAVLKRMYANVKRLPFEWHVQQAYAKTDKGMGIHTLNIDGDIGPMLQAMKLKTLKDTAEKAGPAVAFRRRTRIDESRRSDDRSRDAAGTGLVRADVELLRPARLLRE